MNRITLPAASARLLRQIADHSPVQFEAEPRNRWRNPHTGHVFNGSTFFPLDEHGLINVGDGYSSPVRITAAGRAWLAADAAEWNSRYPVGTPVVAYPGVRPEHPAYNPARRLETVTRTPAWTLGHGAAAVAVVSVEGHAGGICLSHVDVVAADAAAPGGEGR